MSSSAVDRSLFDSAVYQQTLLERLKSGEVSQFQYWLKQIDKGIREKLSKQELTEFSRSRLEKQLAAVDAMLKANFDGHYDELAGHLIDTAEITAEYEAAALAGAVGSESFEAVVPATAQINATVFAAPLSVRGPDGGKLLDTFLNDWSTAERKAIVGAIRQGVFEGQTNAEIIRNIRGTKANNFKDGILNATNRHAGAIVRTAVQHVASVARKETLTENGVEKYKWDSTLDSRTSDVCKGLDGEVFEMGKGPLPPAHINCRSSYTPELPEELQFLSEGATRASKDGYVPANTTYYEWLKGQPEQVQIDALGKTKAAIFRSDAVSPEEFKRLNMGRNFKPITLAEMRKKNPKAFAAGLSSLPKTKKAQRAKVSDSQQKQALVSWLGEDNYQRIAGELDKPRVKQAAEKYGLNQAEQAAIWQYSKSGYEDLNDRLRGKTVKNPLAVSSSADVLRGALDKLPNHVGTVYRRTTLPKSILEKHQIGDVVNYNEFTSTSYGGDVFDGEHRLIIKSKSGKNITDLSYFDKKEREVLFNSPSEFYVQARYYDENGVLTIRMKEL